MKKDDDFVIKELIDTEDEDNSDYKCPECGSLFIIKEGRCTTCFNCGWSKCSI
jgi:DNA-directed RNA polymerase subunit RPC12/RpoP